MPKLAAKNSPPIRFEVGWCRSIPLDECGDKDIDRAEYVYEHFPTFGLAVARAKRLLREGKDQFGTVEITEQRHEPHPDFPGRFWWRQSADMYVDEIALTYCRADLRTIDRDDGE